MNNQKPESRKPLTLVLLIIYLLALIWLILFKGQFFIPVLDNGRILNLIPLMGSLDQNGILRFSEIRINIIVFIPLGIFICMLKTHWLFVKKVLAIIGLTLAFETIQYIFNIGRADITDVLSNTLGGIIGIGLYALLSKILKGRTDKVFNGFIAIITFITLSLIAFLLISHHWIILK